MTLLPLHVFIVSLAPLGRLGLIASSAAVLTALAPLPPLQAQYVYGDSDPVALRREQRLSDSQKDELFRAYKSWKQRSYNQRVSIINEERRCIDGARNHMDFRSCIRDTKVARQALREEKRSYLNPVRRRVGLPPLQEKPRSKQRV